MTYLLLHISLWVLIAMVLGAVLGWMLRRLSAEEQLTQLRTQTETRGRELEAARSALEQDQQARQTDLRLREKAEAELATLELARTAPQRSMEVELERSQVELERSQVELERLRAHYQASQASLTVLLVRTGEGVAPEWLLDAPDGGPDDLKRIQGIGAKLERKLNSAGIFQLQQLAKLDAHGVAWLSTTVGTPPERILEERWVAQARKLSA